MASIKMMNHLNILHKDLIKTQNMSRITEIINGMSFDHYHESACVVRYMGVKLIDRQFPKDDPQRQPYIKIVNDLCMTYNIPESTKKTMLNGYLAKEAHQLDFEFKFTKGKPGNFYFGKFMAQNNGGGEVDLIFFCYRLGFKLSADEVKKTFRRKFLCFTLGTHEKISYVQKALTEKDKKNFEVHFRLRMFEKLGRQLKS